MESVAGATAPSSLFQQMEPQYPFRTTENQSPADSCVISASDSGEFAHPQQQLNNIGFGLQLGQGQHPYNNNNNDNNAPPRDDQRPPEPVCPRDPAALYRGPAGRRVLPVRRAELFAAGETLGEEDIPRVWIRSVPQRAGCCRCHRRTARTYAGRPGVASEAGRL